MEENWVKLMTTAEPHRAEVIRGMLEEHNIKCVVINKRDSVYTIFGEVEIYTSKDQAVLAAHLISKGLE